MAGCVDGRLHLLLGHVQAEVQTELQVMTELPPELLEVICFSPGICPNWRSSGAVTEEAMTSGLAPGKEGEHLDGGIIHLGQGRDRQLVVGHGAGQGYGHHQQRGGHGPQDEEAGRIHYLPLPRAAGIALGLHFDLAALRSLSAPSTTTSSPGCEPLFDGRLSPSLGPTRTGRTVDGLVGLHHIDERALGAALDGRGRHHDTRAWFPGAGGH